MQALGLRVRAWAGRSGGLGRGAPPAALVVTAMANPSPSQGEGPGCAAAWPLSVPVCAAAAAFRPPAGLAA